jgi:predicted metal-dependent phosphoesterase TrpH
MVRHGVRSDEHLCKPAGPGGGVIVTPARPHKETFPMNRIALSALLSLFSFHLCASTQSPHPDLVLQGKVTGAQNKTYFEIPFDVPAGVHRISIDFSYSGKERKTTLDLGIADPERFRGNSGGNKSHFTLSETDATPSYLPGAIPAGKWRLLISVPNIRPSEQAEYRVEVYFNSRIEDATFASAPLATGRRWYRGDLHMHTAHSDANCASQSGKRVPCPVFLTVQAAVAQGLDFIAITDHNTDSQYDAMRELQPFFDRILLIPGREITTFWGHFNIFAVTQYIDYRAVAHGGRDVDSILRDVQSHGGIASVNHADSPDGEVCMGCAWEPPIPVDMSLFTGIEAINGTRSSADFWDRQLAKGLRLTAIGGSDNHNALIPAGVPGAIGHPTTVVEAEELSVPAILDGIRRGRVFIDLTASRDKTIDVEARDTAAGGQNDQGKWTSMGDAVKADAGDSVSFRIHVAACPHAQIHVLVDGHEAPGLAPLLTSVADETPEFKWASDGHYHWVRCEVRDASGALMLVSNPIYVNPTIH